MATGLAKNRKALKHSKDLKVILKCGKKKETRKVEKEREKQKLGVTIFYIHCKLFETFTLKIQGLH